MWQIARYNNWDNANFLVLGEFSEITEVQAGFRGHVRIDLKFLSEVCIFKLWIVGAGHSCCEVIYINVVHIVL